jgi:hypothetical protein
MSAIQQEIGKDFPQNLRLPSQNVLNKYGITLEEWITIFKAQGWKCPICNKIPKTGSPTEFNIDHKHVPKWKKMPPEQRKKYVRGILCQWCNRSYMAKAMTIEKAQNIIKYLTNNPVL